jgi:FkbM family methyltransferase
MISNSFLRKYLRSYPQWNFRPPRVEVRRNLHCVGSNYGGYLVDPSIVPPDPVIYSLGVGKDISFDLSLIEQYSFTVHAFDPTPEVRHWLESQSIPEQFRFHPVGIADLDGEADFHLPPRPDFISHSIVAAQQYSNNSIRLPVMTLSAVLRTLGHKHIDILKMDIEGAEYGVLADLIREKIRVGQILVEFHHRLSSTGIEKTRSAISALNEYGMRICYICPRMEVFTFVSVKENIGHESPYY